MNLLEVVITAILSILGFSVFFKALNISMLKLFVPIQKKTNKLRRKSLYRDILGILFITLTIYFVEIFSLNNIIFGILLGFFISFDSVMFESYVEL